MAFLQIVQRFGKIPARSSKPLYCLSLYEKKICVTGYKRPQQVYLKNLVNFMGGSIKPEIRSDIAFLVTNTTSSEQYNKAVQLGIPVRRTQWILDIWNRRNEPALNIREPAFERLTVSELSGIHVCFCWFGKEETEKLEEQACNLGVSVVPLMSELCTHVVVNAENSSIKPLPQESPEFPCFVVVLQWFTLLCRMKIPVSAENYQFFRPENIKKRNSGSLKRRFSRPRSCSQSETVNEVTEATVSAGVRSDEPLSKFELDDDDDENIPAKKSNVQTDGHPESQSSVGNQNETSALQCNSGLKQVENISAEKLEKMCQRRKFKCIELYETEKNYVEILNSIIQIFKVPLEKMILEKQPLITEQDIKVIFQKFIPILKVHERILSDLEPVINNWRDDCRIGDIFIEYNSDLTKAYPQFINYMDIILQTIDDISKTNPEFQKFLKKAESNPACQRQGLKDLIVWPMQRIGRLVLLLQGILKDTTSEHLDCEPLKAAIQMMEDCGRLVNEDKRKTESVVNKLEMFYDIENCPNDFLKIKKYFVAKYTVQEVLGCEATFRKPATLVLLLFQEYLEICKQRTKGFSGLIQKRLPYKHMSLLPLDWIKHVVLINSPEEHKNKFAVMVQPSNGLAYRNIYSIQSGCAQELVHKLSTVVAKCVMKNISEIQKEMNFTSVMNYFTAQDAIPKKPADSVSSPVHSHTPSKTHPAETPEEKCSTFIFQTPEKYGETGDCTKSPSSKSLQSSHKKGKLRRAFSSFLTPIQNIVAPASPGSDLKSGVSSASLTSLDPSTDVMPSTTPKVRKKLKSNSFGAKTSHSDFK